MKKFIKYSLATALTAFAGMFAGCSDIKMETPELPDLPKVENLQAQVSNRVVTLTWQNPATSMTIQGLNLIVNNNAETAIPLEPGTTSYSVYGQPMEDEYLYTVKVRYSDGSASYVSEGQSVVATVPYEELANVSNLMVTDIQGRNVTLSWTLPSAAGITGVYVGIDGNDDASYSLYPGEVTTVTLAKQPNGQSVKYRVKVQYDGFYASSGEVCPADIPYMETKAGFLLLADSPSDLPDDDEVAAAAWFYDNYVATNQGSFITPAQLPSVDPDEYGVIWIMVDRKGLEVGWQKLPASLVSESTIQALQSFTGQGGSLYLSNMATQLTVPLGIVPANMPINSFASGDGGSGDDVWTINPYLGWDFQGTENFYDRTAHEVFTDITLEDPNGYGYNSVPMIGPGEREDHNSLWDINPYWNEAGNPAPNCVKWFENVTNSLVLATWGHVRDHCVAGLVDFNANDIHGRCIANGFAAYEWNQNSGVNPYQQNIEKLTSNILNLLK